MNHDQISHESPSHGYQKLEDRYRKISNILHLLEIAYWDEATMMPEGGGVARGDALAEASVLLSELSSAPELAVWLEDAEGDDRLTDWQRANVREIKRQYTYNTAIPKDLVKKSSVAATQAQQAWRKLRAENNWKDFLPYQKEVLELAREEAAYLSDVLGVAPYEALLQRHSPGLTVSLVRDMFSQLKAFLPEFIDEVLVKKSRETIVLQKGRYSHDKQKVLGLELMKHVGFDFNHGRLDESHHPFCGGVPRDVRLTTRYEDDNFFSSLMAVLHETGHAMYNQNLPKDWLTQPIGQPCGTTIHESQSLFMEMQVSRSREFQEFIAPICRKFMSECGDGADFFAPENLYRNATRVEKSLIRVDADEVTYPLHVILRFEIEVDLIEGRVRLEDLPELWNQKMTAYLGLSTKDNFKDGCMQDVHWPSGGFGYFPGYTFGALIAAQLSETLHEREPGVLAGYRKGEFTSTQNFLRENIWSKGSYFSTLETVRQATGKELSTEPLIRHLKRRYIGG